MGKGNGQIDPNTYLNLARLQGYVSNPNVITPYGTSYTTWGQFDQAGYDRAMADYSAKVEAGLPAQMPSKENFVTNKDQATVTQALSPILQGILSNQQQAQYAFGQAGKTAAEQAAASMAQPFKYTGPDIQTSIGGYGTAGGGPAAGSYGTAGGGPTAGQYGFASSGPTAGQFGMFQGGVAAPQLQTQANLQGVRDVNYGPESTGAPKLISQVGTPTLQRALDVSGLAAMPVNAGTTAQQAILSRLQPQLQAEREQLKTSLTNQGLVPGGEAYNTAMQEQSQRENDLLTQAALQGISLDMSARQQGLGEQQTLGSFANQAALSQLGANLQGAGFTNQALQQMFGNQMDVASAQRAAQQQQFAQRMAAGEFGNQAQLAAFNAALQNQQAQNAAIASNFGQGQSAAQMMNQATAQNFGMGQSAQQLANQAIGQNFGQGQAAQQLANQAVGQNYGQALGAAQFGNQAVNQLLNQQLGLYNQPLSTATNLLQASQFQNPNFGTGFQAPNYSNVGTQMQNQANANTAQQNAGVSGMMGLAGGLIGAAYGQPMAGYQIGSGVGRAIS